MAETEFTFFVVKQSSPIASGINRAYLREDAWDDWFQFSTMYDLIVYDETGNRHNIGSVKIGQFDMKDDQRRPDLPKTFNQLDERFFP